MPTRTQPPVALSLRETLSSVELIGAEDVAVSRLQIDAATVEPGDLFVAIAEQGGDPYVAAYQAASRGASAVVTDRFLPELGIPQAIVSQPAAACAVLAHALAGDPSQQIASVICVGTKAAVVAQVLVEQIFQDAGIRPRVATPEPQSGDITLCTNWWARDPRLPAKWLQAAVDEMVHAALAAVPPAVACRGGLSGFSCDALVLGPANSAGLPRNSVAYHGLWLSLVDQLKPTGFAIIAAGHPSEEQILRHLDLPAITVGVDEPAEITARIVDQFPWGQTLILRVDSEAHVVRLRAVGRQAALGVTMAAAIGVAWGLPLVDIVRSIARVDQFPGYLEPITYRDPCPIFLDSAGTLSEVAETLEQLRPVTRGRLLAIVILPPRLDRSWHTPGVTPAEFWLEVAQLLQRADRLSLVCPPVDEEATGGPVLDRHTSGMHKLRGAGVASRVTVFADLDEALVAVCRRLNPEDVLVVVKLDGGVDDRPFRALPRRQWACVAR